jgi:hypothetical protein
VIWPACHGPIVKPALVRACIEKALRRGWLSEHRDLTLKGSELSLAEALRPNHDLVEVVRDIVAGRQPKNPKVRKLN